MDKELLLQIFKAPYNRQSFIENVLIPTVQGKVDDLEIYDQHGVQELDLTATEEQYARSAVKYGEFTTRDEIGRTVELYEVILHDHKQVERSRVGIAALIKKQIIGNNAVLVNFAYQNPQDRSWRFSFIAHDAIFTEGEMVQSETNPKRYTYVFGEPDETYRTALDRFYTLGYEYAITIGTLKDAFGVEAMSKAFFDEYRDIHYNGFVDYLTRSEYKQSAFKGDEKAIRDFVKKLLGRIVFLYFIQKKGWLGASNGQYEDGDKNFMSNFYKMTGASEDFYAKWLSKLFFDTLNNSNRTDEAFELPDNTTVRIPYLNGGLFEKEQDEFDNLTFPADLFSDLFEFFDQYNFTIYEDSPEEHTVAVDPEMLGHIFENLLEDNKDKGAFYTPKEIVQYMTQESLIEYLYTQIPEADRNELTAFVKNKDNKLSQPHKKQIDQKLDTVKICDPAIGSGAFPMGLLQEIFGLKERIAFELNDTTWNPATVKEHIIQNSIYGVDIEKGAVDIARLRFWLSLIVDEDMPKALPNLDYKIVVGNSLVSKFEDEIIEVDWSTDDTSGGFFGQDIVAEKTQLLKAISEKQKAFFTADNDVKPTLAAEIRALKLDILAKQLELMIETKGAESNKNAVQKPTKKQLLKYEETEGWKRTLSKINVLKTNGQPFKHFDWRLDFPEVLNPLATEDTGFDIIVGNPPYIEFKNLDADFKSHLVKYSTANGKYDIYIPFTELSIDITKPSGSVVFINPTRFMHRDYGKDLRHYVKDNVIVKSVIDFGNVQNFENAITYTGIFHYKNTKPTEPYDLEIRTSLKESPVLFKSDVLDSDVWYFNDPQTLTILDKIKEKSVPLRACVEGIFQGVATGKDAVFVVSKDEVRQLELEETYLVKWLKGKDIAPYEIKWSGNYCIYPYDDNGKVVSEEVLKIHAPNIYKHLEEKRNELMGRGYFENSNKNWYELWNQRNKKRFERPKLITLDTASKNSFTYDEDNFFGTTTTYSLIPIEKVSSKSLLAILNSSLLNFYHKKNTIPQAGGYFRYQASFIENLPVKIDIDKDLEKLLGVIANYILEYQKNAVRDLSIIAQFQDVIDALVFELYFPEEFKSKGIEIAKHAKEMFVTIEGLSEEEKVEQIKRVYDELREKKNPLRNQIKLMKIELKELLLPVLSV